LGGQPYKKEKANGFAVHFFLIITYSLPTTWSWRRWRSTWAVWVTEAWVRSSAVTLVVVTSLIALAPLALANLLCILLATAALALVILMVCVVTRTSSAILSVVVTRT
jgi:hypothetical protein